MSLPKPTDGELVILKVLWNDGPKTVRQVHAVLTEGKDIPYTTVLSALQAMLEKGLVLRDESSRQHVYRAALSEADARRSLVDDLLEKAFQGSALELMIHALESGRSSPADLETMKRLIQERRKEQR